MTDTFNLSEATLGVDGRLHIPKTMEVSLCGVATPPTGELVQSPLCQECLRIYTRRQAEPIDAPDAGARYRIQRWDGSQWVSGISQPWDVLKHAVEEAQRLYEQYKEPHRVLNNRMRPVHHIPDTLDMSLILRFMATDAWFDQADSEVIEEARHEIIRLRKLLLPFGVEPDRAAYMNFVDWLDEDQEQAEVNHQAVVAYFKERGISPAEELF